MYTNNTEWTDKDAFRQTMALMVLESFFALATIANLYFLSRM
jgi:hypothetical protein